MHYVSSKSILVCCEEVVSFRDLNTQILLEKNWRQIWSASGDKIIGELICSRKESTYSTSMNHQQVDLNPCIPLNTDGIMNTKVYSTLYTVRQYMVEKEIKI